MPFQGYRFREFSTTNLKLKTGSLVRHWETISQHPPKIRIKIWETRLYTIFMAEFWIPGATMQKCMATNLPISWCPPKVSSLIVHNLTDNNMVSDTIWHLKATLVEVLLVDDSKNRSICIWPKVENVNLQVVHIWTTSLVLHFAEIPFGRCLENRWIV